MGLRVSSQRTEIKLLPGQKQSQEAAQMTLHRSFGICVFYQELPAASNTISEGLQQKTLLDKIFLTAGKRDRAFTTGI